MNQKYPEVIFTPNFCKITVQLWRKGDSATFYCFAVSSWDMQRTDGPKQHIASSCCCSRVPDPMSPSRPLWDLLRAEWMGSDWDMRLFALLVESNVLKVVLCYRGLRSPKLLKAHVFGGEKEGEDFYWYVKEWWPSTFAPLNAEQMFTAMVCMVQTISGMSWLQPAQKGWHVRFSHFSK